MLQPYLKPLFKIYIDFMMLTVKLNRKNADPSQKAGRN